MKRVRIENLVVTHPDRDHVSDLTFLSDNRELVVHQCKTNASQSHILPPSLVKVEPGSGKTLNRTIFEQAQQMQIVCNVVRDRALCNFYYPAVVRRGPLQIAISTAGYSGALAQRLRKQFESQFGPEWESWLRWLGEARSSLYDDPLNPRRRRTMLHRLASQKKQAEFFQHWGIPSNDDRQSRK